MNKTENSVRGKKEKKVKERVRGKMEKESFKGLTFSCLYVFLACIQHEIQGSLKEFLSEYYRLPTNL